MTELCGWAAVATMGLVAFVAMPAVVLPMAGPPGPARVVFLSRPDPDVLPKGVSIDRWGRDVILGGVDADAARALYAMGAVMVYPVRAHGCVASSRAAFSPAAAP